MHATGLAATALAAVLTISLRCAAGVLGPRLHHLPGGMVVAAARVATVLALSQALFGLFRLQGTAFSEAAAFAVGGLCAFALSGRLAWGFVGGACALALVKAVA